MGSEMCIRDRLYRLEEEELVVSRWSEAEGKKVPRKYYAITEQGRAELSELEVLWREINQSAALIMEDKNYE